MRNCARALDAPVLFTITIVEAGIVIMGVLVMLVMPMVLMVLMVLSLVLLRQILQMSRIDRAVVCSYRMS